MASLKAINILRISEFGALYVVAMKDPEADVLLVMQLSVNWHARVRDNLKDEGDFDGFAALLGAGLAHRLIPVNR